MLVLKCLRVIEKTTKRGVGSWLLHVPEKYFSKRNATDEALHLVSVKLIKEDGHVGLQLPVSDDDENDMSSLACRNSRALKKRIASIYSQM